MNCQEVIELLPLLLYEELDDETTASLGEHLESCAECAARFAELKETAGALDEWKPLAESLDARAVSAAATGEETQRHRWSLRPMITGLAAGLLLMTGLFFIGVNVQRTEGGLVVSFGRAPLVDEPAVPDHLASFDPQAFEERIRQVAFERIDQSQFELAEDIGRFLEKWDALQAQQRDELLALFSRTYQQDLSRLEEGLVAVAEGAAEDHHRTWRRLNELALAVSRGEFVPVEDENP